jgi:hypothetical protein
MAQEGAIAEPNEAVDLAEFRPLLEELFGAVKASVCKHGDWRDYDAEKIFDKVAGEFDEYREAFVAGDVTGEHGQEAELMHLAVTALKGIFRHRRMRHG